MTLSGAEANFILDIAMSGLPDGVPMPYLKPQDDMAASLEKRGLVERHHLGARGGLGVLLTAQGRDVVAQFAQFRL